MGLVALIFLFLNLLLTGCGAKAAPTAEPHAHGTFLQQLRQTDQPVPHPGVESVLAKRDGVAVPVEGFPAHPPFQTIARSNSMETYPCSQCHDKPLAGMLALRRKDQPNSHWQVKLQHAPDNIMSCQTCHGEGDMNQLVTLTGKQVSMDAPYQVCAQCHASQVNDWAGGAHGKRLGGWAPPRVVQTCTGCHNPHAPAFESRWPAVLGKGDANYPGR
jgi:hypothetical protein